MNYLFYGKDRARIQKEIQKIVKAAGNDCDLIYYDLKQNKMSEVLQEVTTFPFFSSSKVVVVRNCDFLAQGNLDFDTEAFEQFLNHPILENMMILTGEFEKCDGRKKIVKLVQKTCRTKVFPLLDERQLRTYIIEMCREFNIKLSNDNLNLLVSLLPTDTALIDQQLEKLACYPNEINEEVLRALILRNLEDNVFALSESILKGKFKKAYSLYKDMITLSYEPVYLLAVIASQLRFAYQVKVCMMQMMGEESIASYLKAHPYRVKLTMQMLNYVSIERIMHLLDSCFICDSDIKSGKRDKYMAFELFLIQCREETL